MADVFPSASYVDVPPKEAGKIAVPLQSTTVSGFADILNHQVEWRFLRCTTQHYSPAAGSAEERFINPAGIVATRNCKFRTDPRASQLWVWIDARAGVTEWDSGKTPPTVDVELYDFNTVTKLDTGYKFDSVLGTLTDQYAGLRSQGWWDQRFLFSGDRTDPGSFAPRRLDIPEAYRGNMLYVSLGVTGLDVRSITVMQAYQPQTPQEGAA